MTDWDRVDRLRTKGVSWDEIAADPKVGFTAPKGSDPGRSLKAFAYRRRSGRSKRSRPRGSAAATSVPARPRSRRRILVAGLAGGAALAVIVALVILYVTTPAPVPAIVTYCGGEGTVTHYHTLLVIDADGAQQPLPYDSSQSADIGYLDSPGFTNSSLYCPAGAIHAIHTHDGSGIIHVELPSSLAGTTPTLGEFFEIWGEPLSTSEVWSYSGSVHAVVRNAETGSVTDYSGEPARIPLFPAACGLTCDPVAIPSSLIFGGAYGNGASGGVYTGEIIWLNVTTVATASGMGTGPHASTVPAAGGPGPVGTPPPPGSGPAGPPASTTPDRFAVLELRTAPLAGR